MAPEMVDLKVIAECSLAHAGHDLHSAETYHLHVDQMRVWQDELAAFSRHLDTLKHAHKQAVMFFIRRCSCLTPP